VAHKLFAFICFVRTKSEPGECLALLDKLEAETLAAIPRAVAALKELRLLFTCVSSSLRAA